MLPEREIEIFRLRYGFYDKKYTLEECGRKFDVTKEIVRMIEKLMLVKKN